jgi:hypothetical protein
MRPERLLAGGDAAGCTDSGCSSRDWRSGYLGWFDGTGRELWFDRHGDDLRVDRLCCSYLYDDSELRESPSLQPRQRWEQWQYFFPLTYRLTTILEVSMLGASIALSQAGDKVLGGLPLLNRLKVRGVFRECIKDAVRDSLVLFAAKGGTQLSGEGDTPFIDFWEKLIAEGKIKDFMTFLVNEFLPKLFALIIMIIESISAL